MTSAGVPARALVTGAAQGLGLAIAEAFLEAGTSRVVLGDRNVDMLLAVAARLRDEHGATRILVYPVDVTDDTSVAAMVDGAVTEASGIDALVPG